MKTLFLAALALMAAPALAAQTPAPKPLDPVGNFSFQVMGPDGNAMAGQFVIKGVKDAWEGIISSEAAPEAPLSMIVVDGQVLTFAISTPDGTAIPMRLTFVGDDFSGQLDFGGMVLAIAGKRIKPAP